MQTKRRIRKRQNMSITSHFMHWMMQTPTLIPQAQNLIMRNLVIMNLIMMNLVMMNTTNQRKVIIHLLIQVHLQVYLVEKDNPQWKQVQCKALLASLQYHHREVHHKHVLQFSEVGPWERFQSHCSKWKSCQHQGFVQSNLE